jgi:hypothetical protein
MSQHWPGDTATPPPDGTHRVVRGNRAAPTKWQYLPVPVTPDQYPLWTFYQAKAGIWPWRDAERLARLHAERLAEFHSAFGNPPGDASEVWSEWIGPPNRG